MAKSTGIHSLLPGRYNKLRVAIIGSGNWGMAVAKIIAENVMEHSDIFEQHVPIWVHQESVKHKEKTRHLTDIINEEHENVKYLPGIKVPPIIRAESEIEIVAANADLLVINLPHQFIRPVCRRLFPFVKKGAQAISCVKGLEFSEDGGDIKLMSDLVEDTLKIYCGQLSGGNLATEVALSKFSETTIGWNPSSYPSHRQADEDKVNDLSLPPEIIHLLFHRAYFHVSIVRDVASVSLGGALKNVVAVAAGFIDGMGWGDSAKAAIMRRGLLEIRKFTEMFYKNADPNVLVHESCGIGDLITSCAGGRNYRCSVEFIRTGKSMCQLENEMLGGQKLQGPDTAKEVYQFLEKHAAVNEFPVFAYVHDVCFSNEDPYKVHVII